MQAHIVFDTLEYAEELKKSGMTQNQAEAITKATSKAFQQMIENTHVATKNDLIYLRDQLQIFMVKCVTSAVTFLSILQSFYHFWDKF